MSRTYRNYPARKYMRTPRYKWKLQAGISAKQIVTDYDDKPISARNEKPAAKFNAFGRSNRPDNFQV